MKINLINLRKLIAGLLIPILVITISSCSEDPINADTDPEREVVDPTPVEETAEEIANNWIYDAMVDVYLWNSSITTPSDFTIDPEEFFYSLLLNKSDTEVDNWSWIVPNYQNLVSVLSGESKSFGYNVGLYLAYTGQTDVVAYVEYIDQDTPASNSDIKRGDIISSVNGEKLTTLNYYELLFETENQELGFSTFEDGVYIETSETISLTAEELQKNPIHLSKIIDSGSTKIGYLHYTSFLNAYDKELYDTVFSEFRDNGIKDIVIDLRYNGGGSVLSSQNISSMLLSDALNGEVLTKKEWNSGYQTYFEAKAKEDVSYQSYIEDVVLEKIEMYSGDNIDTYDMTKLDIDRLFVLTTGSTASASELVINNLTPYIDVTIIGEQTTGKHVASITLYDTDPSPSHDYGIQPIVYQSTNANDDTDYYWVGFTPDYEIRDDYNYDLGDPTEPMLAKAIELITGVSQSPMMSASNKTNSVTSEMVKLKSRAEPMYDEKLSKILRDSRQ